MRTLKVFFLFLFAASVTLPQESASNPAIDPLALRVLQATTDSVKNAKAFSFRAIVSRERLGSNDEVLTFFRQSEVTVSRPDKLRILTTGDHQKIDLYHNQGQVVLYSPEKKLFTELKTSQTLDQVIDRLEERDIQLPMSPLLRADPYKTLADGLTRAAVIGRVEIEGKTFHHLVFSEKDAEWQIWVEGGGKPTLRRAQVVYRNVPREPRVTINFSDWNLSATPSADYFVFKKPQDAVAISFLEPDKR
jgi:hypothetical protein